jgi:hypothetical protein
MVLGLKIGYDHFHYMMHQNSTSQSPIRLDMLVFRLLSLWIDNKRWCVLHVVHASLDTHEQHDLVFHNTNKYYYTSTLFLLLHEGLESCLINLHGVVLCEVVESWANIASGKFLCVVDVGSWCFSCQHSKSLLSHEQLVQWPDLMLRFGKVSNKSFTSPRNSN